jgi:hypothetical protein
LTGAKGVHARTRCAIMEPEYEEVQVISDEDTLYSYSGTVPCCISFESARTGAAVSGGITEASEKRRGYDIRIRNAIFSRKFIPFMRPGAQTIDARVLHRSFGRLVVPRETDCRMIFRHGRVSVVHYVSG